MRTICSRFALIGGSFLIAASPQTAAAANYQTFTSVSEATNALIRAANARDQQAMGQLFGPDLTNLLTGDAALDARHFRGFAADLSAKCEAIPQGNDRVTLEIGRESWPFPIPLVATNGVWQFDTVAGEDEIINRHIGRDEFYAIGVCRAYVKAQRGYASRFSPNQQTPRYATSLRSEQGKTDGLYWPTQPGETPSPLSSVVAEACAQGYHWAKGEGPRPFHGYFYKILTRQGPAAPGGKMDYVRNGQMSGGFALVAYPVRWGESGIMTFIVNQDGVVYQQSLGDKTPALAARMKEYNPDGHWTVVQEAGIADFAAEKPRENR